MLKLVPLGSYDFHEPLYCQIKLSSRGLIGNDRADFIKVAGNFAATKVGEIKFARDERPVLFLAIGTTEDYGPNRNGDGFRREILDRRVSSFEKFARAYRNHDNKDPAKSYGRIPWAGYNPEMKRAELLVGYNGSEKTAEANGGLVADKECEKLDRKEDLAGSMACWLDPNTPVLTGNGYTAIDQVVVGDMTYTHKRRWRRVTKVVRRKYTGTCVRMRLRGLPEPLTLTADHPMWCELMEKAQLAAVGISSKLAARRPSSAWVQAVRSGHKPFRWHHAGHLEKGDQISYLPVGRVPGVAGIADTKFAGLAGIFMAEGNINFSSGNPNGLMLSVHADDWSVRGVPALVESIAPGTTCTLTPRKESDVAFALVVNSAELSRWMLNLFGRSLESKIIPWEIFNATRECKLAFAGRWLDGDGWPDMKGLHWSTARYELALQLRDLLVSTGIAASIYRIQHPDDRCGITGGTGIEYTVNVSWFDAADLAPFSHKVLHYDKDIPTDPRRSRPALVMLDDYGAYGVSQIEQFDVEDADVFNLEVEEDESYSVAGLGSHNCKVSHDICSFCSNKAPTRKHYCDANSCSGFGCKDGLTKVAEDGRIQYVDNPDPLFFDFSHVVRPADRIAYGAGLLKAASGGVYGGAEMAEMAGLLVPARLAFSFDVPIKFASYMPVVSELIQREIEVDRDLHDNVWNLAFSSQLRDPISAPPVGMDTNANFKQAMHALALEQVVLPVQEWLKLFGGKEAADVADDVRAQLPGVYARICDGAAGIAENPYNFDSDNYPSRMLQIWAKQAAADYSLDQTLALRRLQRAPFFAVETADLVAGAEEAVKRASEHVGAEQLAQHYGLYTMAALSLIQSRSGDDPLTSAFVIRQNHVR